MRAQLYRPLVIICLLAVSILLGGCSILSRKTKAGLQVITNDISSSVFLDGQYLDKTPYIGKELKPGTYSLRIEPDDSSLTPHETSVTLRKGLLTVVTWKPGTRPETSGGVIYEMEPLSNKKRSELSLISLPDGVIVTVDNQGKEFTPLLIEDIEPGQHEFEVSLPSYETQKHNINVIEGHRMNITVKLAKAETAEPTTTQPAETDQTASQSAEVLGATASASLPAADAPPSSPAPATSSAQSPTGSTPSTGATVTIEKTNYFVSGKEVLRVRASASSDGAELGFAEVGSTHPYLQETTDGWYKINFDGKTGWVSATFAKLTQ
jgi:uncharacterized protein YgiM (DUF1202 family)